MSRFGLAPIRLLALAVVLATPHVALAATAAEFLNAPVWYAQFEVTFTSNYQGTSPTQQGPMTFTSSMVRVLTGCDKLNLRSQGPGATGMQELTAGIGTNPSSADAQRMTTKMMTMMDNTANWIAGGASIDNENATDAEITASGMPMGTVSIDYTRVDTGKDLVNETGSKYDCKITRTMKGSGAVQVGGMGVTNFELSTSDNSFSLVLPFAFNAQGAGTKLVMVTVLSSKGTPGEETRTENDQTFDLLPSGLVLDNPPKNSPQGGVLIRGTFDPATGKIVGQQSFPAHYDDISATTGPGTLLFKYTLTTTPPPAKK
jgi:hypothetical protein